MRIFGAVSLKTSYFVVGGSGEEETAQKLHNLFQSNDRNYCRFFRCMFVRFFSFDGELFYFYRFLLVTVNYFFQRLGVENKIFTDKDRRSFNIFVFNNDY